MLSLNLNLNRRRRALAISRQAATRPATSPHDAPARKDARRGAIGQRQSNNNNGQQAQAR
jgi:hypothetical protein